jgi:DNA invertase Pin-like site-specific DNA recombinase
VTTPVVIGDGTILLVLLVWRLDRLGRSVRHLVTLIDQLRDRSIGFRSICDGAIDTTTPSGELIFGSSGSSVRIQDNDKEQWER